MWVVLALALATDALCFLGMRVVLLNIYSGKGLSGMNGLEYLHEQRAQKLDKSMHSKPGTCSFLNPLKASPGEQLPSSWRN
jgi:hypothetical protein